MSNVKYYSVNIDLDKSEIKADLGIRIIHDKKEYSLNVNNSGDLILTSLDEIQLIIKPKSANCVEITSGE
jgi:hypothetical protein